MTVARLDRKRSGTIDVIAVNYATEILFIYIAPSWFDLSDASLWPSALNCCNQTPAKANLYRNYSVLPLAVLRVS